jgi:signal transduction histidine kinase
MSTAEPAAYGRASRADSPIRLRELEIVREIAESFLTATQALEVYRLALQRLTPLVHASFASIFLRDPADALLLKLECAHNWPQASARHLADLRIRIGRGPTGRAVAERVAVEVEDIFADESCREWWEPARELGFAALISLPLMANGAATGAVSFYYARPHRFSDDERHALSLLAAQLAAMSSRARRFEEMNAANVALKRERQALLEKIGEAAQLERSKDEFLAGVSHDLRTPLTAILGYAALLSDGTVGELPAVHVDIVHRIDRAATGLLRLINDLIELTQIRLGHATVISADTDAVLLARHAADRLGAPATDARLTIDAAAARIAMTTDADKVVRILCTLLGRACDVSGAREVRLVVRSTTDDAVIWEVRIAEGPIGDAAGADLFDELHQLGAAGYRDGGGARLGLELCARNAELLGGSLTAASVADAGGALSLRLPRRPPPD